MNYWQGKNVFITGANGFIGGGLAQECLNRGANVFALIRNEKKDTYLFTEGLAERITIIRGELTDRELIRRIFSEERIHCCFHLAAQVEVGVAMSYPYLTYETNIKGTYTIMEAVRENRASVDAVVVASSDKAYGSYELDKLPYREDYPLIPIYPYDVSKACADLISRSYAIGSHDLPVIITRFCNIYGPGQLNFSALIPDTIRSALGYSTFIPRGNGLHIRDYIYLDDVVDLYLLLAERLAVDKTLRGEVFNAGTNEPKQVKDIVQLIYTMIGKEENYLHVQKQWENKKTLGEIDCQFMAYDKVNSLFGWKPEVSFDEGLKKTIEWFSKYLRLKYGS